MGGERRGDAADQRADELEERPDGGDANGPGADAADLRGPDSGGGFLGKAFRTLHGGHDGNEERPRDQEADEHGEADGKAHKVSGPEKRELHAAAQTGRTRADAEEGCGFACEGARGNEEGEECRADRAHDDGEQAGLVLAYGGFSLIGAAGADLENLGGGDAFRVRQVSIDDEGAAERDREGDAKDAAEDADQEGLPERKFCPPANHDEGRQDEDDRGHGAADRGDGLDGHVFPDRGGLERAQQGH